MSDQCPRDILVALKAELTFLKEGGYRRPPEPPWRARSTFQDSPICPNFRPSEKVVPCDECILMELVPPDRRDTKIPCHHIPLTEAGDTVDSVGRWARPEELEAFVENWLRKTIEQIEEQRGATRPVGS
jgi:hypothetical protein